jgi:hypothetical protein
MGQKRSGDRTETHHLICERWEEKTIADVAEENKRKVD